MTECDGKCPCKKCGQSVDYCKMDTNCDPTRKRTKLKLYVEVFVVGLIEFKKTIDIVNVANDIAKGLQTGIPQSKVPEDHRFFV